MAFGQNQSFGLSLPQIIRPAITVPFIYLGPSANLPVISEFVADNKKSLLSGSGKAYDWIEIHNPGTSSVDLGDWYLTDDPANPTMWGLPAGTILGPDERLIVFASGLGATGPSGELHATFKINASGGYLALVKSDGTIGTTFSNYPKQEEDYAYGIPEGTKNLIARWKFDESSGTVAKDSVQPPAGLIAGSLSGSFNLTDPNPGNLNEGGSGATNGVDPLGPTLGKLNSKPPWQDNFTVVYSGQIYDTDGRMSFSEHIDDSAWLKVNDQILLNNQSWNTMTSQSVDFGSPGWYNFELRMGNGSGGAGTVSSPGFGFDPEGGTNFNFPQNTSSALGDMFRTRGSLDASISGQSSPTWESGKFGNALRFDGVDDIATHALSSNVTLSTYSLSLWVKPDGINQGNNVSFFNSGSTGKDFQICFDNSGQYKLFGDSGSGIFGSAVEGWTHLAVVCDGTNRKLYLNGNYVTSAAGSDNIFQHYRFGVNRGGNKFFKGWLDEVCLFDAALSDAQVNELFSNDSAPVATYLNSPTPGKANGTGFSGFVADTKFSVDRGFFTNAFSVSITSATPGASIRYTTDGSSPSATHGNVYTSPIPISSTTIVRAMASKTDYHPTDVDTQSYFFLNDVIQQSANGATPSGWPNNGAVNGQKMVYGMDPDIVGGFNTSQEVVDALLAIPTLSIATEMDNLFGQSNGIYVNAKNDGRTWERPMSLELLNPDGTGGYQINAGLRIRGGYSRSANNPKHSFRVFFRSDYGQGNLHYPMFEDEGAEEFDKFDLRTSQNYSWAFGGPANNTMVREVWSRDTQAAMNQPYTRSRYYHLYLNGQYWGIYMTQERVSGTLGESYLGGKKEDFDTIHQDGSRQINATSGTIDAYDRLWQQTIDGWTDNDSYFRAQGLEPDGKTVNPSYERLLDVDNLADYMLIVYYNGDRDGPASRYTTPRVNNYYGIYNRANPDGWKFPAHDMEHSLGRGENNMVTPLASAHKDRDEKKYFTAHFLHEQLTSNQEYAIHFADRFYLRNYNEGLLTEESAKARIAFRAAQIDKAIIAESARWGDTKSNVPKNRNDWVNNVNMVTDWMTGRNAVVLNQLRTTRLNNSSPYWYPSIDPPGFSQHGGQVGSSFRLSMIDPNTTAVTIHYTLDGSDPRLIGGAVSSTAQVVQPSGMQSTILLDSGAFAKAFVPTGGAQGSAWTLPGFDDSAWQSGLSGIGYDTATTYRSLFGIDVISMRNVNASVYCRIPFTANSISEFTNLTLKMKYDDGFVAYLNGEKVASAAAPANPAWNGKATSSHNDSQAQQYVSFDLTPHINHLREGDNILAIHGLNVSTGSSDMLIVPRIEASKIVGGTQIALPNYLTTVKARARTASGEWSALHEAIFQVDVVPASIDNLVLSEIMYNPAGEGGSEYLEIRNVGPLRIDLTGVVLGGGFDDFTFGPLTLAAGESAVVVQDLAAFNLRYLVPSSAYYNPAIVVAGQWPGGKLNNAGEDIYLKDAKGENILSFKYDNGGDWPGRADGRGSSLILPDPTDLAGMTLSQRNNYLADGDNWNSSANFHGNPGGAEPADAEIPKVIISEILAHTDPPHVDAIELHNPGTQAVDISGWRLTERGSSLEGFSIPNGTVIPPGGFVVFDETDFNPNGLWNPNAGTRGPNEFALSGSRGGDIWLIETDDAGHPMSFLDHVEFGASLNGVSFGRWPNGTAGKLYPMKERSLFDESSGTNPLTKHGGPNPGPMHGTVMISEIMYNPPNGNNDLEFIELYNSGATAASLTGWKLGKGIEFDFSPGTSIAPGQSLVVVGFELNATDKLNNFRNTYGIGPDVVLVGGWKGNLNNGGETISLLRPDQPPPDDPTYTPMIIEESVTYSDSSPWPTGADGNGSSLIRKAKDSWSNHPDSWEVSPGNPTPGPSTSLNTAPTFNSGNPPATISVGSLYQYRFFASDPDGNALAFSSNSLPSGLNLTDEANGSSILSGTSLPQAMGTHSIVITVSDGIAPPVEKSFVLTVEDTTPPQLTLLGSSSVAHEAATPYFDSGASATDNVDGDLSNEISVVNPVNVNQPGSYVVTYSLSDQAGNEATTLSRTVVVSDSQPPVIHINGLTSITHEAATPYVELGAFAMDALDGNLTNITIGGSVNINAVGANQLTYDLADAAGNAAIRVVRTVTVVDTTPPVITLLGSAKIRHQVNQPYLDPGVIATDTLDGNLTSVVVVGGNLDTNNAGTYNVSYNVSDQAGNSATPVNREVVIVSTPPPVISLLGSATVTLNEGGTFVEPGFIAIDSQDGDLTGSVVVGGDEVNSSVPNTYRITYDVNNSINIGASQVIRTVIVQDVNPPTLTLLGAANVTHEAATPYLDPGASAFDTADGNLTNTILVSGTVNVQALGIQTLTYSVSDQAGNAATPISRSITVRDSSPPIISLQGDANGTLEATVPFVDLGATALDALDGNLTASIVKSGDEVNSSSPGIYQVVYEATDNEGNLGRSIRTVTVRDSIAPTLSLQGASSINLEAGIPFVDPGATAFDALDGDRTSQIIIGGSGVNEDVEGVYSVTYSVSDLAGNTAQTISRQVTVQDTLPPVLELVGDANVTIAVGVNFVDPGATANDFAEGNLTDSITVTGLVNSSNPGDYLLTYSISDQAGNSATQIFRQVSVRSLASPVITLLGPASVTLEQGTPFIDPGVTAFDAFDGNLTSLVRAENNLDVNVPGTHHIYYSVVNASGLAAEEVFRTIIVLDLNDAPLTNEVETFLSSIPEDAGEGSDNPGSVVSSLVEGITDLDSNDPLGLALVDKDDENGTWQYSLDGGETFLNVGPISDQSALLLRADDPMILLRFVPRDQFHESATVTFRAWDQTIGNNGQFYAIDSVGGRSAFSSDLAQATIKVTPRADAPYFTTSPVTQGMVLKEYSYNVIVREPDGENFVIQSGTLPDWLSFTVHGDGSASLQGTPGTSDAGVHAIILKATDASGKYAEQSFAIAVTNSPYFITDPVVLGTVLTDYSYDIVTRDPDGEPMTLQFEALPNWLTYISDQNGFATLAGSPAEGDIGTHSVKLKVTDASGQYAEQSFAIEVSSGKVFDLEPGWNQHEWFGWFFMTENSWIYHTDHGWIFPTEKAGPRDGGIWFWSESLGWHWTREDIYPFLYLRRRQRDPSEITRSDDLTESFGWFFYRTSSQKPRLLFDYKGNSWMQGTDLAPIAIETTVNNAVGGSVSGGGTYGHGDEITITATAAEGYKFKGWSGDYQGTSPSLSLSVTKNLSLKAVFEEISSQNSIQSLFD